VKTIIKTGAFAAGIAFAAFGSSAANAACPSGYICATGVPVFGGTGPNCYHVTFPSDHTHVYGVFFNSVGTPAADALLLSLQSAIDNNRSVMALAQPNDELCDLDTGKVLSIRGVSPIIPLPLAGR